MTPIPPKAQGNHPLVQQINQLRQCVIERTLMPGENVDLDRTAVGVRVHATVRRGGTGKGGGGSARGPARWV